MKATCEELTGTLQGGSNPSSQTNKWLCHHRPLVCGSSWCCCLMVRVLTGFLWRAGEGSLDGAAVRVVSATDAALVLHLVGADLPVAANFLSTVTRHRGRCLHLWNFFFINGWLGYFFFSRSYSIFKTVVERRKWQFSHSLIYHFWAGSWLHCFLNHLLPNYSKYHKCAWWKFK